MTTSASTTPIARTCRPLTSHASRSRWDDGFTMIEMMAVLVIMSILAAITVPSFVAQRQRAVDSTTTNDLVILSTLAAAFQNQDSEGPFLKARLRSSFQTAANTQWDVVEEDTPGYCIKGMERRREGVRRSAASGRLGQLGAGGHHGGRHAHRRWRLPDWHPRRVSRPLASNEDHEEGAGSGQQIRGLPRGLLSVSVEPRDSPNLPVDVQCLLMRQPGTCGHWEGLQAMRRSA